LKTTATLPSFRLSRSGVFVCEKQKHNCVSKKHNCVLFLQNKNAPKAHDVIDTQVCRWCATQHDEELRSSSSCCTTSSTTSMTLDTNMLKTSSSSSWCPTKLAKARRVYITRDAMIGFQTLRIASQRCFLCSSLDKSAPSAVLHFALLNSLTASQLRNADGRKLSIASLFEECDQSTSHRDEEVV
jgi:hypothetical protein